MSQSNNTKNNVTKNCERAAEETKNNSAWLLWLAAIQQALQSLSTDGIPRRVRAHVYTPPPPTREAGYIIRAENHNAVESDDGGATTEDDNDNMEEVN